MLLKNTSPKVLSILFGRSESNIYEDAWLISKVITKRFKKYD